jgi:helicase conserved domain protein
MAKYMSEKCLRTLLRESFTDNTDRFKIIKEVASLIAQGNPAGQEFVLRLLARLKDFQEWEPIVYSLVRQVGLFPYLEEEKLSLKDALAYEVHRPEGLLGENVVFHHAQAEVYYSLLRGENVVLSAPTSFGKSLIIDAIIASRKHSNIFIIVPTIALIDETRKRLSKFKDQYKIITHPSQSIAQSNVFILTQERALEIIPHVAVDFFVIDEFYKLGSQSNDEERCHILNQVFYMLVKKKAQFYLLGPNIEAVIPTRLGGVQFKFFKTDYKTVVLEPHYINENRGKSKLEMLIDLVATLEGPTLVFCKSPASANGIAKAIFDSGRFKKIEENEDLACWLRENYHPEWVLPRCLELGIGIHHGKVPRAIAQKCVRLFNERKIQVLVCTSTLIEGVNTKAENVIVYDNIIARKKIDYFTFNNICGRSGRMSSYLIGHVYLFESPPVATLPSVDFPVFTQDDTVSEKLLINLDVDDLSESSRVKLSEYLIQHDLSQDTLKRNSYIDLNKQLELAREIQANLNEVKGLLTWREYPSNDQLREACKLIWEYLNLEKIGYGVRSKDQLYFRINQFRVAGSIKGLIENIIQSDRSCEGDVNDAIELAFDIQRHWINYQFPRFLRSLSDIVNDIFKKNNLPLCDYSYFAGLVESYFSPSYVLPLDEYGLPIQISKKIGKVIEIPSDIDAALEKLRNFIPSPDSFSKIEREFIEECQAYI